MTFARNRCMDSKQQAHYNMKILLRRSTMVVVAAPSLCGITCAVRHKAIPACCHSVHCSFLSSNETKTKFLPAEWPPFFPLDTPQIYPPAHTGTASAVINDGRGQPGTRLTQGQRQQTWQGAHPRHGFPRPRELTPSSRYPPGFLWSCVETTSHWTPEATFGMRSLTGC